MKTSRLIAKLTAVLLIPMGILLAHVSSVNTEAVEKVYSKLLYRAVGQPLSLIFGIFPFSIAEFIVILLPLAIIFYTAYTVKKLFTRTKAPIHALLNYVANLLLLTSLAFFLFITIWGLNYYRQPFAVLAGLDVRPSSADELEDVCEALIDKANTLRADVDEDTEGVMDIQERKREILKRCVKGFKNAASIYPELGGRYGNPKPVLLSMPMSYTGISGVYFPFTAEANVNISIPNSMIPCTASHEMAHQRGFAREDEANYIAYLACSMHPDADFQYSGTLLAAIHSMNALYGSNPDSYFRLSKSYNEGVMKDITALDAFWDQFEGPVERTSERINNAYLKANKQKDGVQSYGRMVDLLIAEHRKNKSR